MKNLKKLLAVALSLAILLTLTVPVMAAGLTNAEKVELLGILQGEGDGITDKYLSQATTRVQGAILLLRLIGKEDEALAYAGGDNFTDVVGNEWFAPVLAYLKANESIGFVGYPDGTFQPRKVMSGAEFYKVLLTVLGYVQGVDYTWAQVADKAADLGLVALENPSAPITNADMADAILEALQAEMKSGVALLDSLIADGIISSADANAAGLITAQAIVSAVPTNADEITVTFSKPVEGTPVITVKSGLMSIFVNNTWNDAKTQVVLKRANSIAFTEGTYDLAVGDMKAAVKFDKEVAQTLAISKSTILADTTDTFEVVLYNQYGKKMSISGQNFSATAFNKTTGTTLLVSGDGSGKFTINTAKAKENEIITVTAMHHQSTIVGQAELTAVLASKVTQFAMTEVVIPEKATMVNTDHSNVEIKYQAYDQYGNAMTLKDFTNVTSGTGLTFISSDSTILKIEDLRFDKDGKLTFKPLKAGTVTLSVLVNSAAVVTSLPITVFDPAAVSKVVIGEALKEVVEDETTEISFVALDQFGNELEKKNVIIHDTNGLSFSPIMTDKSKISFVIEDGALKVKPLYGSKGYITVYYSWKGALLGSFTINVWAKAIPTSIENVAINSGIELGAPQTIDKKVIRVVDQYARPYDVDGKMLTSDFAWKSNPDTGAIISNPAASGKTFTFNANSTTEGAVTYTVSLFERNADGTLKTDKDGKNIVKADSAYSFTLKAVDVNKAANGVTYKFDSISTLYTNALFTSKATAEKYVKEVKLIGTTNDGTVVTLNPGMIYQLTSSNANVKVVQDGTSWFIYSGHKDAQTSTLRAYDKTGKLLCSADVSATTTRAIKSVVFGVADKTAFTGTLNLATGYGTLKFAVNDEYAVNMLTVTTPSALVFDLEANGFFASSDSSILKVTGTTIEAVGTGEVTLTYVTNAGLTDSVILKVTK